MNKRLIIPALTLTVLAGTIYGASNVSAEMGWHDNAPIVQRLVERFGLDENEVQEVFAEMHDEHQLERQMEFEEKIEEAVASGEITPEQRQVILEKHAEMMGEQGRNRENFQNMSREERQALIETRHAEMDLWAQENGIDLESFFGKRAMDQKGGYMGRLGRRGK